MTQEPLKPPLSACRLGQLYNREGLIQRLLRRKTVPLPPNMNHVESRKDIKDLNIVFEPKTGKLVCPIMKVEFDAGVKGVFLWSCGCVISSKALDELSARKNGSRMENTGEEGPCCPVCNLPYNPVMDIIQLAPDLENIPDLKAEIAKRKENEKQKRKDQRVRKEEDHENGVSKDGSSSPEKCISAVAKPNLLNSSETNSASLKRPHSAINSSHQSGRFQSEKESASKKVRLAEAVHKQKSTSSLVYQSIFKS